MSKTSRIKNSLSPEQTQFFSQKTISATHKIKDWIQFFSSISVLDRMMDKRVKLYMGLIVFLIVLAVITVFDAFASEVMYLGGIALIFVLGAILLQRERKRLQTDDINNYLREFLMPVLQVLKDKAGPRTKLAANLDFRNPRKALDPVKSIINGRNQSQYNHTYIVAKTVLSDGAALQFVVQDEIKDQDWTKRSASGKTKYKSKIKVVHHCYIKLILPKSDYKSVSSVDPRVELTELEEQYEAKVKLKFKVIGDHILRPKEFFDGVQLVYAQFDPLNAKGNYSTRRQEGEGEEYYEDDYFMPSYIWYGSYFDRYDYDSLEYSDSGEIVGDAEGATVFAS